MKITAIETRKLELPYKKPLITAANRFESATGLLVRALADGGLIGHGYAEVFPRSGETLGSASYAIEQVLAPLVVRRDLRDIGAIRRDCHRALQGNTRAKAALDTALSDLSAKSLEVPLNFLFGGAVKKSVRVIRLVSLGSPDEMAEESSGFVRQGFTALKLKIQGRPPLDVERVAEVRRAVGEGVYLKVDANEAYDLKSAVLLTRKLADLGVEVFEQPVRRDQIDALAEIKRRSPIKIEADQTVRSLSDAFLVIQRGAVDSINTSPMKAGGIVEAKRIADLCEAAGVDCVLGNIAGSMVGDAAALHLALSSPGISPLCEIGEFEAISGDPLLGLATQNGFLAPADKSGLGLSEAWAPATA